MIVVGCSARKFDTSSSIAQNGMQRGSEPQSQLHACAEAPQAITQYATSAIMNRRELAYNTNAAQAFFLRNNVLPTCSQGRALKSFNGRFPFRGSCRCLCCPKALLVQHCAQHSQPSHHPVLRKEAKMSDKEHKEEEGAHEAPEGRSPSLHGWCAMHLKSFGLLLLV